VTFYRFARNVCKGIFKVLFRIKVQGIENRPEGGGFIVCSNHRTFLDPIFIGIFIKQDMRFMAKEELFKIPVLGFIIKRLGAFPVKRGIGDTSALDCAEDTVKQGKVLAMFPEGTRSRDGKLLRMKSGAAVISAKTGGDIVPVAIAIQGNKPGLFKKIIVSFGPVIKNEELGITGKNPSEIKAAGKLLTFHIQQLLDSGNQLLGQ